MSLRRKARLATLHESSTQQTRRGGETSSRGWKSELEAAGRGVGLRAGPDGHVRPRRGSDPHPADRLGSARRFHAGPTLHCTERHRTARRGQSTRRSQPGHDDGVKPGDCERTYSDFCDHMLSVVWTMYSEALVLRGGKKTPRLGFICIHEVPRYACAGSPG